MPRAATDSLSRAAPETMSNQGRHRVLILGCGYVGSALARRLVHDGHDVVATTTTETRTREIAGFGATPHVLSLHETERLHDALADREVVFLCTAPGRTGQSYRELYAEGARRLLAACRDSAVRRTVYTSSTRVYAQDDGSWVDEDSATHPPDEDGQSLVTAERTLLDGPRLGLMPPDFAVMVLRLAGIHGPGRELARRIHPAAGTSRSDGDVFVNLIHRDDIVEAMTKLLAICYQGVMNVCDGYPVLRRELYDREIARVGLSPIQWTRTSDTVRGKRVSIDRLRQTLRISPKAHA